MTLSPVSDTYADSLAQDKNFGARDLLRLNQQRKYTRIVYLSFELDGLPADAADVHATLTLAPTVSRSFAVRAHRTGPFDEMTLTWNDRPAVGEMLDEGSSPQVGVPLALDVSASVHGQGSLSLALTAEGVIQASTWFPSRESGSNGPLLTLRWTGSPPAEVPADPADPADPVEPEPTAAPAPDPTEPPGAEPTESASSSPTSQPTTPGTGPPGLERSSEAALLGAAIQPQAGRQGVEDELAYLESQVGTLEIRRVFDPGFTRDFMAKAGLDVGRRATHYSFKPDMSALERGDLDQDLQFFFDSIPSGHPTILTIWHEPENNFVTSDEQATYRAAWKRFARLVKSQERPELSTSWVMMAYSWHVVSGREPMDWWPGDGLIDIVGIDTYNEGSLRGTRWDSPGRNFGDPFEGDVGVHRGLINEGQPIIDWIKERGAKFGVAEFGTLENTQGLSANWTDKPTKAEWIREAVKYYESLGAVYIEYFHAGPYRGPWWLDAESDEPLEAFRELLDDRG